MIYLDSAATTLQKPPQVAQATARAMNTLASPGRGGHQPAMEAAEAVYRCRELAGEIFDASPEQVVFTMNATHGLNIAIKTLVLPGDQVVISGFEHNAVVRPLHALGARVTAAGQRLFDPKEALHQFEKAITPQTKAVVCTCVSNVFGYVLPYGQIAALCRSRGAPLILDASQAAGVLPVSLRDTEAAFIAMPGHKSLYGPQGTGILLCGRKPRSLLEGGSGSLSLSPNMPKDLPDAAEAGTHNVCGICGLYEGLRFVKQKGSKIIFQHEALLRRRLSRELRAQSGVEVFDGGEVQTGVLSFRMDGMDCEELAAALSEAGICVRAGLHCAPLAHETAGTLDSGTIRVSFSTFNTVQEVEIFCRQMKKLSSR